MKRALLTLLAFNGLQTKATNENVFTPFYRVNNEKCSLLMDQHQHPPCVKWFKLGNDMLSFLSLLTAPSAAVLYNYISQPLSPGGIFSTQCYTARNGKANLSKVLKKRRSPECSIVQDLEVVLQKRAQATPTSNIQQLISITINKFRALGAEREKELNIASSRENRKRQKFPFFA